MTTNGVTCVRCDSSTDKASNISLLGVSKYGDELPLLIFIEQFFGRIVSDRSQSNRGEELFSNFMS